jgi:hypothetical protein
LAGERARQGDETRASLKSQILPCPREGNDKSTSDAYQKIDMRDAPEERTEQAG